MKLLFLVANVSVLFSFWSLLFLVAWLAWWHREDGGFLMSYISVMSASFSMTLIKRGQWFIEGLGSSDLRIRSAVMVLGRCLIYDREKGDEPNVWGLARETRMEGRAFAPVLIDIAMVWHHKQELFTYLCTVDSIFRVRLFRDTLSYQNL